MKRYCGDYIEVRSVDDHYGLNGHFDTIDDAKDAIERSHKNAIANGYKPTDWRIVFVEWYKHFDDQGNFIKSETLRYVVEEED